MKKVIMISSLALLASTTALAQTGSEKKAAAAYESNHHVCIMAGEEVWTSLGLTTEQMASVKDLQASCKADYAAAKTDEQAASVLRHEEKLKGILTTDQYTKWSTWCAQEAAAKQ
jgi:hypothetical protein